MNEIIRILALDIYALDLVTLRMWSIVAGASFIQFQLPESCTVEAKSRRSPSSQSLPRLAILIPLSA